MVLTLAIYSAVALSPAARAEPPQLVHASEWVRAHTNAKDRIFVWGQQVQLYIDTRRQPASRFPHIRFLTGLYPTPIKLPTPSFRGLDAAYRDLETDFAAHPPVLVLDSTADDGGAYETVPILRSPLAGYIRSHYTPATTLDGIAIYRRRD
jgi:hypothetical protein